MILKIDGRCSEPLRSVTAIRTNDSVKSVSYITCDFSRDLSYDRRAGSDVVQADYVEQAETPAIVDFTLQENEDSPKG